MSRCTKRPARGLAALTSRFVRDTGGAVAIWFAVLALPMAVLAFGLIDVNRASVEKRHLQDAVDAATLLAARSTATSPTALQSVGEAALKAQLTGASDATLKSSSFKLVGTKVIGSATATVVPVIANLWIGRDMEVGATAEVMRSSTNLEMALVLDLTQSMSGTKIADLKQAAKDLIDLVISDVQTPYYSKAALVPYSYGVNLGSTYANTARGTMIGAKSMTAVAWQSGTTSKSITGITRANPAVVTSTAHGFVNGDWVYISGVKGMTDVNGRAFEVANKAPNTFELKGVSSSSYSKWTSAGTIQKCLAPNCDVVVTTSSHGYLAGDVIYVSGMTGVSIATGYYALSSVPTVNSYSLSGVLGPSRSVTSTSGSSQCTKYGCALFRFTNDAGGTNVYQPNTCATERPKSVIASLYDNIDDNDYTDVSSASLPAGIQYTSGGATCLSATISPLSSDKATLKNTIGNYSVSGSTAGQIGVGWGWYMISPTFGSIFPTASQPAAYGTKDLLKVVVIMTDGGFNTPYCRGVQASNAEIGDDDTHINCANKDGFVQAKAMCEAMKKKGVIVYTVGFALGNDADAIDVMNKCASGTDYVYLPSGGSALKDAFAAIGRDITKLRLSK